MLQVINIEGEGFKPLIDFNCWRVAQNTYSSELNDIESVRYFGRHLETDEVFVLLEGKAIMFTAGFDDIIGEFKATVLKKNKIYNVKQRLWHALVLEKNSKVLIVENSNTCDKNSNNYFISDKDRQIMKKLININN